MSWYSVIYVRARAFKAKCPLLGRLLQISFYTPVVLELCILMICTYIYTIVMCGLLTNYIQAAIYVTIYFIISFMMCWSYFRAILAFPIQIPNEFYADNKTDEKLRVQTPQVKGRFHMESSNESQTVEQMSILNAFVARRALQVVETDQHGRPRYCFECCVIKPDRSHHCSSCGFCSVRFDHHCPYINTCVAHHNYKYFVLFLFYFWLWLVWSWTTSIESIVRWCLKEDRMNTLGSFVAMAIFTCLQFASSIWPIGELLKYHYHLISLNETTCEQAKIPIIRGDPTANYNIGKKKNFEIVFGCRLKLFPVKTFTGDGIHHEVNYTTVHTTCQQAKSSTDTVETPEGGLEGLSSPVITPTPLVTA